MMVYFSSHARRRNEKERQNVRDITNGVLKSRDSILFFVLFPFGIIEVITSLKSIVSQKNRIEVRANQS
jgi:hypothetical protein